MNFEEYYKCATETAEPPTNTEHKLAISDEQRENLMKRIMLLKMKQTQSDQHDESQSDNSNCEEDYQVESQSEGNCSKPDYEFEQEG